MKNNQHKFTQADEDFARALSKDYLFRQSTIRFIRRVEPSLSASDTESIDLYAYGMALKLTTIERFRYNLDKCRNYDREF